MQNFNNYNNINYNPNVINDKLNSYENGMNNTNAIPNGFQQSMFGTQTQTSSQRQQQFYPNLQPMSHSLPQINSQSIGTNPNVNSIHGVTQTDPNVSPMRPQMSTTGPTAHTMPPMASYKPLSPNSETNLPNNQYLSQLRTQTQQISTEPAILPTNGQTLPPIPVSIQSYSHSFGPQTHPFSQQIQPPKAVPPQPLPPPQPQLQPPPRGPPIANIPNISQSFNHNSYGQNQGMPSMAYNSYSSDTRTTAAVPPPPQRPLANSSIVSTQPNYTTQPVYNGMNYTSSVGQQNVDQMTNKMSTMSVHQSWNQMWNQESINLMTEKDIRTKAIISELQKSGNSRNEFDSNCNKDIMRSTLTKVPDSASLLQKARLPFGILIHPFKTDDEIPIIHESPIVRCRSCRTYINPFVRLLDQRRWQCNLCLRINEIPEEFLYDYNTKQMIDCTARPELNYGSIEYVASVEYMVRPPQPAAYLFVFDCSRHATTIGYIPFLAKALLESLDEIPGDSRTLIGFIAFDSRLHFFNLGDKQPIHLVMPDIQDVFLPNYDNLLVNLQSKRAQIEDFLTEILPTFPFDNPNDAVFDSGSALGPALTVAYKVLSSLGGRITLIQSTLPNIGNPSDGSVLINREDPNKRTANNTNLNTVTPLLNPGTDFYKKLALECSEHQIAVDLFDLSSSYSDLATVGSVSKFSGGSIHYYGGSTSTSLLARFEKDMKHYLQRNIGFEAVMRMRCTRGISIHTFHGNFFVRSTDLLALPNINPDSGYGMQISIDEDLKDYTNVCFQSAILYTSSSGERRIRVHTLSLPVVTILSDVIHSADQEAIIGMISKMAVDRSLTSSISDAREALINSVLDILNTYKSISTSSGGGALVTSYATRLMPLYVLALIKHTAFRVGVSTKIDERVFAMERIKCLPLKQLMLYIYPNLYPIHNSFVNENDRPTAVQLSFANIERNGVYLLDTYDNIFVYICKSVHPHWLAEVFNITQWAQIPDEGDMNANNQQTNRIQNTELKDTNRPIVPLPQLDNITSKRIHSFINSLIELRPFQPNFHILREDSRLRYAFLQYMYDDRNESAFSYYEFLQHLQQQIKN